MIKITLFFANYGCYLNKKQLGYNNPKSEKALQFLLDLILIYKYIILYLEVAQNIIEKYKNKNRFKKF